jgi:hypothetical protein
MVTLDAGAGVLARADLKGPGQLPGSRRADFTNNSSIPDKFFYGLQYG